MVALLISALSTVSVRDLKFSGPTLTLSVATQSLLLCVFFFYQRDVRDV